jgi:hypothetical protein
VERLLSRLASRRLTRLDRKANKRSDFRNLTLSTRPNVKQLALLLLLTAGAILVHGYHPYIEDAEIYVPGIKKLLNPALYPFNPTFFTSHAHLTLFPNLVAGSIRITHLPFEWALFSWHFLSIVLLLLACWHLGRLCFRDPLAKWGGVALIASLLTIPVAGTALYIMDQYLTPRSFSTPAALFVIINMLEKKFWRAVLWGIFIAAIHPLMAVFAISYVILLWAMEHPPRTINAGAAMLMPFGLFPPITNAYRAAIDRHSYFFVLRWEWYEWLGIFGPIALLYLFQKMARRQKLPSLVLLCQSLIVFEMFYFVLALVITIPPQFARLAELQPMRSLHLLYVVLFVFSGGLLAQFVLKSKIWRWIALFVPLCAGMFYVQRQSFPNTSHIEWPGAWPRNEWLRAFLWIRDYTPVDGYFALDPDHMRLPGEDQHGFRAMAERSMLADNTKDSGAVTMFPALAETWLQQVNAQNGWSHFGEEDFRRLKALYGVNWVVLERPQAAGLFCPYQNVTLSVCRIP